MADDSGRRRRGNAAQVRSSAISAFRLVDSNWEAELRAAICVDGATIGIVSPFVKANTVRRLLGNRRSSVLRVITRFNLNDFADGVSDIDALRILLHKGALVRGVKNLHAKLYLFGGRAIVTSANLTDAALGRNHELGFVATDAAVVGCCAEYFEDLWAKAGSNLSSRSLDDWDSELSRAPSTSRRRRPRLADHGVDIGIPPLGFAPEEWASKNDRQAFVKFLGKGDNRAPLSWPVMDEIRRAGCHWAAAYPAERRPRAVRDGAVIFVGRLTEDPNDVRIFGRAIGMAHVPGRDDASSADIRERPWKERWPHYVRLREAEFVSGQMSNGVSLNDLMDTLGADSFASTQKNLASRHGNTDPRRAYRQHPAVELSAAGAAWLNAQLESAFVVHGKVTPLELETLDWPKVPAFLPG